jgi:hypothetical protein
LLIQRSWAPKVTRPHQILIFFILNASFCENTKIK